MAYNQFTLPKAVADFGLTLGSVPDLFPAVPAEPIPAGLRALLGVYTPLAVSVGTEAARSHLLVAPVLAGVWERAAHRVALFIGTRFDVDPAAELTGVCDFILGRPPQLHYVTAPVMMIAEAKNEDLPGGLGPCAAAMVAAQRFNAGRKSDIGTIYGAVSDGERWRFLRLAGAALDIEMGDRAIGNVDLLFGILLHICGIGPAAGPGGT